MSIAQQELDYTTLKWVKDEIQESLNQTRQALEAYVDNPKDATQIRFCATYLHQIYGTLQMVEIYGGALLAEEMELLTNAISQNTVARKEEAYDVLMRSIIQLPAYLEQIENGQQDMPVILMPLLNDLRTARGEHLLSENAFFSPNLGVNPPEEIKKSGKDPVDIKKYARKLRPVYQASLVGIYRNKNTADSLRKIGIVIRELLFNSTAEQTTRLWWVASGIVEALLDQGLEASNSVKLLLGQLDRQIKRIIDNGEQDINDSPPVELLKNLLYYVATAKSTGKRVSQIKMAFNLEQLLPGGGDVEEAFQKLRGSNAELMQSVSSVIKEDLLHIKDQLDIFVRTQDKPASDLAPLSDNLSRISDTLAMLGLGDLHKIIQDQGRNIVALSQSGERPTEMALMEIASSLLFVESSLEGVQSSLSQPALETTAESDSLLPPSEQKQLNNLALSEATKVVAQVKEAFNSYANDTSNHEAIKVTPGMLDEIRGVLAILNLTYAANLIAAAIDYIQNHLLQKDIEPNQRALDLLADVISSIEYYLEAISESRSMPENILGVAGNSVAELGYSINAEQIGFEVIGNALAADAAGSGLALDKVENFAGDSSQSLKFAPDTESLDAAKSAKRIDVQSVEAASKEAHDALKETVEERAAPKTPAKPPAQIAKTSDFVLPEDDIDEEILEIFVEEADEVVGAMKENLSAWKQDTSNNDALAILRRSYHTIKGSGRLAGAKVVGEFAWAIENMLNRVIDGRIDPQEEMFSLLERAENTLEESIKHLKGEIQKQPNVQPLVELADAFANGTFGATKDAIDPIDALFAEGESQEEDIDSLTEELQSGLNKSQDTTLVDIFQKETTLHLTAIDDYLNNYSDDKLNMVTEPLMRALHTLHGSANMATVNNIARLSEHLDRYFRTLHDTKQPVSSDSVDVLTKGADLIKQMMQAIDDESIAQPEAEQLVSRVDELHEEAKQVEMPSDEDMLSIVPGVKSAASDELKQSVKSHDAANRAQPEEIKLDSSIPEADRELVLIFLEEASEILGNTEALIQGWLTSPKDDSIMEELQRSLHTLKGGARMANQSIIADLANRIEVLLENVLNDKSALTTDLPRTVQHCQDWLFASLDNIRQGIPIIEDTALMRTLQDYIDTPPPQLETKPKDSTPAVGEDESALGLSLTDDDLADLENALDVTEESAKSEDDTSAKGLELTEGDLADLEDSIEETIVLTPAESDDAQPDQDITLESSEPAPEEITLESTEPEPEEITLESTEPEPEEITLESSEPEPQDELTHIEFTAEDSSMSAADDSVPAEADEDDDLINIFVEEANELEDSIETSLIAWSRNSENLEHIANIQRSLHTLKGGARMANVSKIADVAHAMESLLEEVAEERLAASAALPKLIQNSHDWVIGAVAQVKNRKPIPDSSSILSEIKDYLANTGAPEAEHEEVFGDSSSASVEVPSTAFEIDSKPETMESSASLVDEPAGYDEELVEIFLEEAEEIQEKTDHLLNDWLKDIDNREYIAELQRALHTLKGGARMANISTIGDLSHAIESLLESVTEGNLEPTEEFPKVIHACHDWLTHAMERVKQRQPLGQATSLMKQLENLLAGKDALDGVDKNADDLAVLKTRPTAPPPPEPVKAEEPEAFQVEPVDPSKLIQLPAFTKKDESDAQLEPAGAQATPAAARATEEQIRVKSDLIDNLVAYAGEINIYNARIGQQLGAWNFNLTELDQTVRRLKEQLRKFEIETEAQIMYRHSSDLTANIGSASESFDPLELDRFSYMQQLSRSMVESLGDLTSIQNLLENLFGETDVLLLQQSRINTDLQEGLMSTRMTPFSSVIARLRRVVRQTCQETGKEAELTVEGAEGEMDRTQLTRIVPALEHILRNAIDHGVELPKDRKKNKKSEAGSIMINFTREGSEVVLRIQDDGAGINVDAIRKKAIERGLIEKNSKVEDDEVIDFILQSGFSTAEKITQISGRGVGMDVVNTEIKQLNGSLSIETEPGKGSLFTIRLPLTVLVNQALMVNVDEAIYAIQLSNIEHVVRVTAEELNGLIKGDQTDYAYADNEYQHLNIGYVLHGTAPAAVADKGKYPLLLARSGDHRVALQVDNLIGRQEIVIKSVGPQLSSINSISGATILPDGEVALILDLSTLIRTSHSLIKSDGTARAAIPLRDLETAAEQKPATVLVVDDSITVRKVTQRLLSRHHYETLTAKDGMDALTVMLEHIPDIILLDIEMPRMDGYELATAVRSDPRLKAIPIIMITSRTGDKHRDRALKIGVNMYMGKPFQEHELLENIQTLLNDQ